MFVSLYGSNATKQLSIQLITFVILSGAFCANSIEWGGLCSCWWVSMLVTKYRIYAAITLSKSKRRG
ncbi:Uncharacterised protein [Providencia alcalifaciens]|nr:Uncharacterised protein [Providencia alcalifaciens]